MSTRFEKLQLLVKNVQSHSQAVKHPDQIKGCLFTVKLPPGATFFRGFGHPPPAMPDGITFVPMAPYHYSVEWTDRTADILTHFELDYGSHPTMDFCRDAWLSWQAGEWDSQPDTDGE